jgi:hypothetical protein
VNKFRSVAKPAMTAEEFINQAKTAVVPEIPPELNPRIMRQVNIDVPETLHWEIQQMVKSLPDMSMRKFILRAIGAEMDRVRAGQGA